VNRYPKILVVDGDPAIQRLLGILLEGEHCRVLSARTGEEGLGHAAASAPDLIILELDLPGPGGFPVLRSLRDSIRAPIMILSSLSGVEDKVRALDAGACDYVVKPFNGAELMARVRALLRDRGRSGGNVFISGAPAEDLATREIIVNGLKLELTAREEAIFQILARRPGALVSCQQILSEIWGNDGLAQLHELRVYITRLRRKLDACGATNLIASERNVGYTLTIGLARESGPPDPASP
jgi:two-component system KDP operon response regulator KdpE